MINCVYIHVPFCEKKCNYCAFCSFELLKYKEKYLEALKSEISACYKFEPLKTLYFGGGTPSLLGKEDFKNLLSLFNITPKTEITLEANPKNLTYEKLKNLRELGFNRLSLGVQSFSDKTLKLIGRNHDKKEIYLALENIKKAGFNNFSLDLIYGLPSQTLADWENTLFEAIKIKPKHISLYGLKIEEGTVFYKFPPKNLPTLDEQAIMYEKAIEILKKEYLHYEFSNFALNENFVSRHNSAYWKREYYYGFGLSASGHIEKGRYTNTFNFSKYLKDPINKTYEPINKREALEEEIFLGLRLLKGIDFNKINKKYNVDIYDYFNSEFEKFITLGLLEKTLVGVKLSEKGVLVSNEILCEFIKV